MHLKQLKLVGFKSFVDSTVVHFPGQLVAVVGPNGCGKSNIIDAVRWVLGESSAKNLRGESMTDVIFNGSSQRKSLGQASVELIFDNSLGRLAGPFTSYAEISIKRVLTRSGDSTYYLNGSRCRRRDITDAFLGTGANARGYSIIGQGTVSRLIEARPEELRVYLEEAAGVSRYKERRRETLLRIGHTRENLARVADIREELDKQLQRLERQAKAAERYTLLKGQETRCRFDITAIKWRDLSAEKERKHRALEQLKLDLEQQQAAVVSVDKDKIILNEQLHESREQFQLLQAAYYQLATDIARLEEHLDQKQREKKRVEEDCHQVEKELQEAESQFKRDQDELTASIEQRSILTGQSQQLSLQFSEADAAFQILRLEQEKAQSNWHKLQSRLTQLSNEFQRANLTLQHLEQQRQYTLVRLEKLTEEQADLGVDDLEAELQQLKSSSTALNHELSHEQEQLSALEEQNQQGRVQLHALENQLNQSCDRYQKNKTEYAALQASQQAAVRRHASDAQGFWSNKPRLVDCLMVDSQWQFACEFVLQDMLDAVVLTQLDAFRDNLDAWSGFKGGVLTLREGRASSTSRSSLADKIEGGLPSGLMDLESIYLAESLDEAFALLSELDDQASVLTKEGCWMGDGWVKIAALDEDPNSGLLARQEKINDLKIQLPEEEKGIDALRAERDAQTISLQQLQQDIDQSRERVVVVNEQCREKDSRLRLCHSQIEQKQERLHASQAESETLAMTLEDYALEQNKWLEARAPLEADIERLKAEISAEDPSLKLAQLKPQLEALEQLRRSLHQAELEMSREGMKIQQYTERNAREELAIAALKVRQKRLFDQKMALDLPDEQSRDLLAEKLASHEVFEMKLNDSREQMAAFSLSLEEKERFLKEKERGLKELMETINTAKMEEQALEVRAEALMEALSESDTSLEELLVQLPSDTRQLDKEQELLAIMDRIKRLGAINLAAIEEYAVEGDRKRYLDEQYHDLTEALSSLEQAIDKMDKETRTRLEETFHEVNSSFKRLFPRLFGGGRAQLELTCDNLLEAGIVVMAQPPGKRNSTIHLLSGGEKAMTAVALVFAIFQLNPSPFCMLDEVDAPLDDVNVGRFCELVREMSETIQFMFITHNKVTMELASHLIGVTMREPGVSRLVAVDVQQALTME